MKKKVFAAFFAVLCVAGSVAGCGSGSAGGSSETPSAAEAAEAMSEEPVAASGTGQASEAQTEASGEADSSVPELQVLKLENTIYQGIVKDGGFVIESCETRETDLVVPDTLFDMPVKKIANSAFSLEGTRSITLPDTVEFIDLNAICWAYDLEVVNLGTGLISVGADVFYDCPKLQELRFPEGMTTIGGCLCRECPALEKVYLPSSVTVIDLLEDEPLVDLETCPNVTIITPEGSAAEAAAIAAGIPVEYT